MPVSAREKFKLGHYPIAAARAAIFEAPAAGIPHQAQPVRLKRQSALLNMCIQLHFASPVRANRFELNRINSMRFHYVD
jgi:hypothetical protein